MYGYVRIAVPGEKEYVTAGEEEAFWTTTKDCIKACPFPRHQINVTEGKGKKGTLLFWENEELVEDYSNKSEVGHMQTF